MLGFIVMERYMRVGVSCRSLRSLLKNIFFVSLSISNCYDSFEGTFQFNSNGNGMLTLSCINEVYSGAKRLAIW